MIFSGNAELEKVLELSDRILRRVQKMLPKSRTLKGSRSSLKPLIVPSYTVFFRVQSLAVTSSSPSPHKKFKSYTAKLYDNIDCPESNKHTTNSMQARRELQTYPQLK
jgi:hypothetical protein